MKYRFNVILFLFLSCFPTYSGLYKIIGNLIQKRLPDVIKNVEQNKKIKKTLQHVATGTSMGGLIIGGSFFTVLGIDLIQNQINYILQGSSPRFILTEKQERMLKKVERPLFDYYNDLKLYCDIPENEFNTFIRDVEKTKQFIRSTTLQKPSLFHFIVRKTEKFNKARTVDNEFQKICHLMQVNQNAIRISYENDHESTARAVVQGFYKTRQFSPLILLCNPFFNLDEKSKRYVLSHEIAHHIQAHVIIGHKSNAFFKKYLSKNDYYKYCKEIAILMETEADLLGAIFSKEIFENNRDSSFFYRTYGNQINLSKIGTKLWSC